MQMPKRVSGLHPITKMILHLTSIVGTYMMLFGIIFLTLYYTVGRIPFLYNAFLFQNIPLTPVLFSVLTIGFICKYIKVSSPYK